jgi:hypothetical protein
MRGRKTRISESVLQAPARSPDDAVEHEFREALKRLGLSVDAEDFDLALSGYGRVMREIGTVRRHLSALQPGASTPGDADGDEASA